MLLDARHSQYTYEGLTWLLLRLKAAVFIAPEGQAGSPPDLRADFPPTTRRAIIFIRYAGAYGLGHVGCAFE